MPVKGKLLETIGRKLRNLSEYPTEAGAAARQAAAKVKTDLIRENKLKDILRQTHNAGKLEDASGMTFDQDDLAQIKREMIASHFRGEDAKKAVPSWKNKLMTAGSVALGLGAIGAGSEVTQSWLTNRDKQKAFLDMLAVTPELKKDKINSMSYFDALWQLNPTIAKNPKVAGTFIKQHMENGIGVPYQAAIDLLKTRAEETRALGAGKKRHDIASVLEHTFLT